MSWPGGCPEKKQALSPSRLTYSSQLVSWHKVTATPLAHPDTLAGPWNSVPGKMQEVQITGFPLRTF